MKGTKNENDGKKSLCGIRRNGKTPLYVYRCRGRTARLLESGSPTLHAIICVLIVVDAAIIVAQIFMDMHAVRSESILLRLSAPSWKFIFTGLKSGSGKRIKHLTNFTKYISRVKRRHGDLWSRYDLHVVRHYVLCEVNWWRFITLLMARLHIVMAAGVCCRRVSSVALAYAT